MTTTTPAQMGATNNSNNGGQSQNSNTPIPKRNGTTRKRTKTKNNNKSKGKGFNGTAKDGPMAGIVLTTNRLTLLSGLYKKFIECVQALANDKDMQHVAHCIEHMQDLSIDDFKPEEINMSDCIIMMNARKMDSNGNPLEDIDGNYITKEVKIIKDRETFDRKCELQKHQMKNKEDKHKKFEGDKKLLLGQMLLQICPTVHSTLDTIPEYEQVKKDCNLIGTIKILQSICYANKEGGTTFRPFKNIKLREASDLHNEQKQNSVRVQGRT